MKNADPNRPTSSRASQSHIHRTLVGQSTPEGVPRAEAPAAPAPADVSGNPRRSGSSTTMMLQPVSGQPSATIDRAVAR